MIEDGLKSIVDFVGLVWSLVFLPSLQDYLGHFKSKGGVTLRGYDANWAAIFFVFHQNGLIF